LRGQTNDQLLADIKTSTGDICGSGKKVLEGKVGSLYMVVRNLYHIIDFTKVNAGEVFRIDSSRVTLSAWTQENCVDYENNL